MTDFNEKLQQDKQAADDLLTARRTEQERDAQERADQLNQTVLARFGWILAFLGIPLPDGGLKGDSIEHQGYTVRLVEWLTESAYDNPYTPRHYPLVGVKYGETEQVMKLPGSYLFQIPQYRDSDNEAAVLARGNLANLMLRLPELEKERLEEAEKPAVDYRELLAAAKSEMSQRQKDRDEEAAYKDDANLRRDGKALAELLKVLLGVRVEPQQGMVEVDGFKYRIDSSSVRGDDSDGRVYRNNGNMQMLFAVWKPAPEGWDGGEGGLRMSFQEWVNPADAEAILKLRARIATALESIQHNWDYYAEQAFKRKQEAEAEANAPEADPVPAMQILSWEMTNAKERDEAAAELTRLQSEGWTIAFESTAASGSGEGATCRYTVRVTRADQKAG